MYYKFASYEELIQTMVYNKSGLRIYTTDLNMFLHFRIFMVFTTRICS